MKLIHCDFQSLYSPKREWCILRKPELITNELLSHSTFFVWGASVQNQTWIWSLQGAEVQAAEKLDHKIPVLLIENITSETDAHHFFLETSSKVKPLHDSEWVAALKTAQTRLGIDFTKIQSLNKSWSNALKNSNLEPHLGVLSNREKYHFLSYDELEILFDKNWDLSGFELLSSLTNEVRSEFKKAILKWNLSLGQTKEVAAFILTLQKKISPNAALTVLGKEYKTPEEFRSAAFTTAQPELSRLSANRIELLRQFRLPPRTSVFGDPNFEKDLLKITHTPRNLKDFELFKNWINSDELPEQLRSMLEIYQ